MKNITINEIHSNRADELCNQNEMLDKIKNLKVLHVTTTTGGCGVDTFLESLLIKAHEYSLPHSRLTVDLNPEAFAFVQNWYNALQKGGQDRLEMAGYEDYLEASQIASQAVKTARADFIVYHDLQTLALPHFFKPPCPFTWFNHVDTSPPVHEQAQTLLEKYLQEYATACFTTKGARPYFWPLDKTYFIRLGIDPVNPRNSNIRKDDALARFKTLGLDPGRPLISQVSRFAFWKNPWEMIDIFDRMQQEVPELQLALVGARESIDDIQADRIIAELKQKYRQRPEIFILDDPGQISNFEVNAFQRFSDVVFQRSRREAFGYTITEAMWKYQPVVATSANGCLEQIRHNETGFISDDPAQAAITGLRLFNDRQLKQKMGNAAHQWVKRQHTLDTTFFDYVRLLAYGNVN